MLRSRDPNKQIIIKSTGEALIEYVGLQRTQVISDDENQKQRLRQNPRSNELTLLLEIRPKWNIT